MSIKKYKLKNGKIKYQARAYLNGRGSKQVCKNFIRKSDAEKFLANLNQQKNNPENSSSCSFENTTFRKEAMFWYNTQKKQFSPATDKNIKLILSIFFELVGHLKPNELHSGRIVCLQRELLAKGLNQKTVNKRIGVIHSVLNFSTKLKRIPYNPSSGYPKLKETSLPMEYWTQTEARDFLEFTENKYPLGSSQRWVYLVYLLAINTGLRAGEIWGLYPRDFNFENSLLRVTQQYDRILHSVRTTKSRKARIVPCNPTLTHEFKDWIRLKNIDSSKTVFQNKNGKPINHDNFVPRFFKKDLQESGVRPIRFHDLRHTAATLMISSGVDIMTVKEILGHSNIKTTLNYVHLVAENVQKVAKSFSIEPRNVGDVISLSLAKEASSS